MAEDYRFEDTETYFEELENYGEERPEYDIIQGQLYQHLRSHESVDTEMALSVASLLNRGEISEARKVVDQVLEP